MHDLATKEDLKAAFRRLETRFAIMGAIAVTILIVLLR